MRSPGRPLLIAAVTTPLAAAASGCAPVRGEQSHRGSVAADIATVRTQDTVVGWEANGADAEIPTGQTLQVTIPLATLPGHTWTSHLSPAGVLEPVTGAPNGSQTGQFLFRADHPGSAELLLTYGEPGDAAGSNVAIDFSLHVTVD